MTKITSLSTRRGLNLSPLVRSSCKGEIHPNGTTWSPWKGRP